MKEKDEPHPLTLRFQNVFKKYIFIFLFLIIIIVFLIFLFFKFFIHLFIFNYYYFFLNLYFPACRASWPCCTITAAPISDVLKCSVLVRGRIFCIDLISEKKFEQ